MGGQKVKKKKNLITSSSQTRIQVVVSGTDFHANFFVRICVYRIPCLRLCPIRKQAMHAGLSNLYCRYRNNQLNTVGGLS